jgi:hypothetical protein
MMKSKYFLILSLLFTLQTVAMRQTSNEKNQRRWFWATFDKVVDFLNVDIEELREYRSEY